MKNLQRLFLLGFSLVAPALQAADAPDHTRLELPGIMRKIKSASLLNGGKVTVVKRDEKLVITVPAAARDSMDTVVKLQLDGSAMDLSPLEVSPRP